MLILLLLAGWWILCLVLLWLWKQPLFRQTWHEPYVAEAVVLIESDDWGPGGDFHAERLEGLLDSLSQRTDSVQRQAVLTADTVLAVPDIRKIRQSDPPLYQRRFLDEDFPEIYRAMQNGIHAGTLVPQLHGLEHLNGEAFTSLHAANDPRVKQAFATDGWWDWEGLDSPLQGHYVDGSRLPTTPVPPDRAEEIIATATATFRRLFGQPSLSTVAPCYLWDDRIESLWHSQGIRYIQTAGYRCTGRDKNGKYIQSPPLIRPGDRNGAGQLYLVRNVMYEPVDGKNTPESACREATRAFRQALPISISTHRYNYTRSMKEHKDSLAGLESLLVRLEESLPRLRYLSSPELGEWLQNPAASIKNRFNDTQWPPLASLRGMGKVSAFLHRLGYRHPKLVLFAAITGLILPAALLALPAARRMKK